MPCSHPGDVARRCLACNPGALWYSQSWPARPSCQSGSTPRVPIMDGPPIFICHSSKDQRVAETICGALEARGFRCWIASRDVAPGTNYQEAIVGALRASRLMVLVFTGNANNSDEIKKELSLAGRHHATVIPVRAEDVAPNDALSYEMATRQWIDLFSGWDRGIERLSEQIWRSLGSVPGATVQQPFQASSPVSGKERSRYPLAIAPFRRRRLGCRCWGLPPIVIRQNTDCTRPAGYLASDRRPRMG